MTTSTATPVYSIMNAPSILEARNRAWAKWTHITADRVLQADPRHRSGPHTYYANTLHNWGLSEAQAIEARQWRVWHRYDRLSNRAYASALHVEHITEGHNGQYRWCFECQASKPTRKPAILRLQDGQR